MEDGLQTATVEADRITGRPSRSEEGPSENTWDGAGEEELKQLPVVEMAGAGA